jgi:hypothetical protein
MIIRVKNKKHKQCRMSDPSFVQFGKAVTKEICLAVRWDSLKIEGEWANEKSA